MDRQQESLLKLLIEVDAICKKHDITYYLAGGTALGAVRSNGFLPWDDDVDLYITRENLQKLEAVIDQELADDRAFVSESRYPWYRNPIARYVDCSATHIMLSQSFADVPLGPHIEFLVMDPVPLGIEANKKFQAMLRVYTELLTPYFVVNRGTAKPGSTFEPGLYEHYRERARSEGLSEVLEEIGSEIFSTPDDDDSSALYCLRWGIEILMYPRRYFGRPRLEDFEGYRLPVASSAECVFRLAYGDTWMLIPPAAEQQKHSAISNNNVGYARFVDDYRPLVDFDTARRDSLAYKNAKYATLLDSERLQAVQTGVEASLKGLEISERLQGTGVCLRALAAARNWEILESLLNPYISFQLSPAIRRWLVPVPVPTDVSAVALRYLTANGRYVDSLRILAILEAHGVTSPKIEEERAIANLARQISVAIYDLKDRELARILATTAVQDNPEVFDFQKWALILDSSLRPREKLTRLVEVTEAWPRDPDLTKCLADTLRTLGRFDQASAVEASLLQWSRNGVVNLEVRKALRAEANEEVRT